MVELQSGAEYESMLKSLTRTKGAAVIDFTAKWCGPCKMIAPVYEELAAEFEGKVKFFKVRGGGRQGDHMAAVRHTLRGLTQTFSLPAGRH